MDFKQIMTKYGPEPVEKDPNPSDISNTETTPQNPTEPKKPEEPSSPQPPDKPQPPPPVNKLQIINEMFGTEFKDEDEFNAYKNGIGETNKHIKVWEEKYSKLENEYNDLVGGLDPSTIFASPQLEILNGLMKKFPGKNPIILTEIASRDLTKVAIDDPIELLILDKMLENPGIYKSKEEAQEDVLSDYNIDNKDDLEGQPKRRVMVAAKSIMEKFDGLKNQVEKSKFLDLKKTRDDKIAAEKKKIEELTEATESLFTKDIKEALKDVEFHKTFTGEDGKDVTESVFKYSIGENYAKSKAVTEVLKVIRDNVIREGGDWNPERASKIKKDTLTLLEALYIRNNLDHLYQAIYEDLEKKFQDAEWTKRHNVRGLKESGAAALKNKEGEQLAQTQDTILKKVGIKIK